MDLETTRLNKKEIVKQNVTSPFNIEDGPFSLILLKLSINTIFRLYQSTSQVRRIVDAPNRIFWRKLIERDLGVVPLFKVDLKLHYLRILKVPLAGTKYVQPKDPFGFPRVDSIPSPQQDGVVAMSWKVVIKASGKVYYKKRRIYKLKEDERIIRLEADRIGNTVLITNQGCKIVKGDTEIYLNNIDHLYEFKLIRLICGGSRLVCLTRIGEVYVIENNSMSKVNIPEPVIECEYLHLDIVSLSITGVLYKWYPGDPFDVTILTTNVQYIGHRNHPWIDIYGRIYYGLEYITPDRPLIAPDEVVLVANREKFDSHPHIIKRRIDPLIDIGFIDGREEYTVDRRYEEYLPLDLNDRYKGRIDPYAVI